MCNITKVVKNAYSAVKRITKKVTNYKIKGGYISSSSSTTRKRKTRTWRVANRSSKQKKKYKLKRKTKGKK